MTLEALTVASAPATGEAPAAAAPATPAAPKTVRRPTAKKTGAWPIPLPTVKAAAKKAPAKKAMPKPEAAAAPAPKKADTASAPATAPAPAPTKTKPLDKPAAGGKKAPGAKAKLVRDSFTMPEDDYELIASLKDRAIMFKRPAKKSELLRAGLHVLHALTAVELRTALDALKPLKAGRPKRDPA